MMKAISILQPWASLVVLGYKRIETRSWDTKYRGPLLIHASAKYSSQQETLATEFYADTRDSRVYHNDRGAIIGMVNLVDTIKSSDIQVLAQCNVKIPVNGQKYPADWSQELAFGDYSPGRYGWLLSDPVLFNEPIPAKGQLGIWSFNESVPGI